MSRRSANANYPKRVSIESPASHSVENTTQEITAVEINSSSQYGVTDDESLKNL